ncbi:MAG TPA: type II toxin-antitoxin system prevent-host-death family antitoxin [Vicinamibacteria bacterium]|nr:type II toxin-antitoxin system prevent-host-death family antitoxin [Vicinamibacteria bacterium]
MTSVSAFEAKTRFGELLERVASGEEIVITRHDKPVARVIPVGLPPRDQVREAVAGLRQLRQQIQRRARGRRGRLSDREARAAIEEGRP